MRRKVKSTLIAAPVLAALILTNAAGTAGPEKKTMTRSEDYVVFKGNDVPSLIGARTEELHLFACGPEGLAAVPFQIDKVDSNGRYVFPDETAYDPSRDGDLLDSNDELVFMARDAGDRCPAGAWAETAVKGVEIELKDPVDGGRAWAYIFHRPGADSPKVRDYVSYHVEGGEEIISSENYQQGAALDQTSLNLVRMRRPDGSWGADVLVEQRQGVLASLLNGAVPLYLPGTQVKKRIVGVIDGPVRVIKDQLSFIRAKSLGIETIQETFVIYYFNGHISPITMNIPVTLSKMFLNIDIYYSLCLNDNALGSTMVNSTNPEGIRLDGKNDPDVNVNNDNRYMEISGPEGSLVVIMDLGDLKGKNMLRTTLAIEEPQPGPPPVEEGEMLAGFWYRNSRIIARGKYRYNYFHYFPYPYSREKPEQILNMVERPVTTVFRPWQKQ